MVERQQCQALAETRSGKRLTLTGLGLAALIVEHRCISTMKVELRLLMVD
jgi:hypothetical protein